MKFFKKIKTRLLTSVTEDQKNIFWRSQVHDASRIDHDSVTTLTLDHLRKAAESISSEKAEEMDRILARMKDADSVNEYWGGPKRRAKEMTTNQVAELNVIQSEIIPRDHMYLIPEVSTRASQDSLRGYSAKVIIVDSDIR